MKNSDSGSFLDMTSYASVALPHLKTVLDKNIQVMRRVGEELMTQVESGSFLFICGSGHSGILPLELYHRAGGPSFVIPLVADHLLPHAGPPLVRFMERTPGSLTFLLDRASPHPGEMIWIMSQSGINPAGIELAVEAKARQLKTVAFTSVIHSKALDSRHQSGKKLYEVCDEVVDLGGVVGDAAVPVTTEIAVGPLSTLTATFLAHSILGAVMAEVEKKGRRCAYTSVNTPRGEQRNLELERVAALRDPLLRQKA